MAKSKHGAELKKCYYVDDLRFGAENASVEDLVPINRVCNAFLYLKRQLTRWAVIEFDIACSDNKSFEVIKDAYLGSKSLEIAALGEAKDGWIGQGPKGTFSISLLERNEGPNAPGMHVTAELVSLDRWLSPEIPSDEEDCIDRKKAALRNARARFTKWAIGKASEVNANHPEGWKPPIGFRSCGCRVGVAHKDSERWGTYTKCEDRKRWNEHACMGDTPRKDECNDATHR